MFNETKSALDVAQVIATAHAEVAQRNSGFGDRLAVSEAFLFYDVATGKIPTPKYPEILVPGTEKDKLEKVIVTPNAFETLTKPGNFHNPTFGEVTSGGAAVPVIKITLAATCNTYDGYNDETGTETTNLSTKKLPVQISRKVHYGKKPESLTT